MFLYTPKRNLLLALFALLCGAGHLRAQPTPRAGYRYWEANPNSLRRVLATQHSDTARLRTLLHLDNVYDAYLSVADFESKLTEKVQLTRRLRRPEASAYRLWQAGRQFRNAKPDTGPGLDSLKRGLDSLQAAVKAFDQPGLGHRGAVR
ncbi:hypothetical protein AUC43_17380 [Hymenobacter sedentarius]|uniref:Uncharacterized protein n=1 Tax=Hymenobacter sedentarius TaxID=1411621 RepID=A0A0U4BTE1_9BACT|nr:hypothetical protein [Hymenobacter sedentarius]ALW86695.1 hypothetical protein AUC43_17380 [Hymenobacter sedentarius]